MRHAKPRSHRHLTERMLRRAETIAEPYYTFLRKGYNVDMASIAGGRVPIEPLSIEPPRLKTHTVKLMLTDRAQLSQLSLETLLGRHACVPAGPSLHAVLTGPREIAERLTLT